LLDQPLRDGARSRRRRSGIRDDQIDLCAAKLLDPARRIDLVSDELDVVARVDAELSVRARQGHNHANVDFRCRRKRG
jgi:hypothetical protein